MWLKAVDPCMQVLFEHQLDKAAREWAAFSSPQQRRLGLFVALGLSGLPWFGIVAALVHILSKRVGN